MHGKNSYSVNINSCYFKWVSLFKNLQHENIAKFTLMIFNTTYFIVDLTSYTIIENTIHKKSCKILLKSTGEFKLMLMMKNCKIISPHMGISMTTIWVCMLYTPCDIYTSWLLHGHHVRSVLLFISYIMLRCIVLTFVQSYIMLFYSRYHVTQHSYHVFSTLRYTVLFFFMVSRYTDGHHIRSVT